MGRGKYLDPAFAGPELYVGQAVCLLEHRGADGGQGEAPVRALHGPPIVMEPCYQPTAGVG